MKTWHAAIASFGTAAFLVAAYIAVLSVSGALFAFTDLSTAGTDKQAPPLKTVVTVKPVKVKPVVARVPEPEPAPAPEPEPAESSLAAPAPTLASTGGADDGNGGGNALSNSQNPPVDDTDRSDAPDNGRGDSDDAALLSDDGVNLSGTTKKLTGKVNEDLKNGTGVDLRQVTDPVNKVVDGLERGLGLDRQGR